MVLEKLKMYLYKYQKYLVLSLLTCISFVVIYISFENEKVTEMPETIALTDEIEKVNEDIEKEQTIYIDIKGEINNPGVYEMCEGSRVIDAIEMSGGLTSEANTDNINLSKKLLDETVIIVPNRYKLYENVTIKNDYEVSNEVIEEPSKDVEETSGKVDLNNATLEELMTLDGIGETKAKAIIEYRDTSGGFKSIEDIKNVSGIGESTYENIKNNITV